MQLPGRLRCSLRAADIAATELDRLAGLGRGHSAMILSGVKPNPTTSTLERLASVLGVSLDWLVRGVGPEPEPDP